MKAMITAAVLCGALALYSCSGSGSNSATSDSQAPISNSDAGSAGTSAPSASSTSSASGSGIDVTAPSNSKGVGKFTNVTVGPLNATLAAQGKQLFETKCTACHKPTDERLVGPGLKGITKIRTPEWIMNMMTNPTVMTHQDPVAEALLAQYQTQMTFQDVSDKDARAIYEFLRQNDAQ